MKEHASQTLPGAAIRYALRGLHIFPLAPGTKVPMSGSNGLKDASNDSDVARARWQRWPTANIAAATGARSGIWVLDIDPPRGADTLADLEAKHGPLPITIETETPRGGRHLYWRWRPGGPEIRNSASRRLGPEKDSPRAWGLDVRGEGGLIILPPSVLADGRDYRWAKNGATAFADAPDWLVELALPPPPPPKAESKPAPEGIEKYVASAAAAELAELERAEKGCRNDALNRAAFALAGFVLAGALPEDWSKAQLETRAVAMGLPAFEVKRTINSAFAAARPRELAR